MSTAPCRAALPVLGTLRQNWNCDLVAGHAGDHAAIAPNCNARRGYQVVKRWSSTNLTAESAAG